MNDIIYKIVDAAGNVAWQRGTNKPDDINMCLLYIDFCQCGRGSYEENRAKHSLIMQDSKGNITTIIKAEKIK